MSNEDMRKLVDDYQNMAEQKYQLEHDMRGIKRLLVEYAVQNQMYEVLTINMRALLRGPKQRRM